MKLSSEILTEAKKLYLSGKTFKEVANVISKRPGLIISPEAIRKRFIKLGYAIRNNREASKLAHRRHLPIKTLIELYIKQKISLKKLARQFKSTKSTIRKILSENNIPVRGNYEALKLTNLKHRRTSFDGGREESAYLIGFVEGDVTAFKKSKYTIRAVTNTTHEDFLKVFHQSFNRYGRVLVFPSKNKTFESYMWQIYTNLDDSFSFLLPENRERYIRELKNTNEKVFLSFLAGYADAEGSLLIKKIRDNLQYCFRLGSENVMLLETIKSKLLKLGFRPILYRGFKRGHYRYVKAIKIAYAKNYYMLEVFRKDDVKSLLLSLPLKHTEKLDKKNLILRMIKENFTRWEQAEPLINQIRADIKAKTKVSIEKAKRLYESE